MARFRHMTYEHELYLKVQCPEELGQVNQCVLDTLLGDLHKISCLFSYALTLCVPVTETSVCEGTDSRQPAAAARRTKVGTVSLESTYCKMSPPRDPNGVDMPDSAGVQASSDFIPTILVEMYSKTLLNEDDLKKMIPAITQSITTCVIEHNHKNKQDFNIRFLMYSAASV